MPEGHASFKTNAISCFLYQYELTDPISYQLVITAHFAYLMVVYSEAYVNERGAARKYIKRQQHGGTPDPLYLFKMAGKQEAASRRWITNTRYVPFICANEK